MTFLTGISSRDGEKFPVLRRAIRSVTQSKERGLLRVIDELRKDGSSVTENIADHIESMTDYDFAHLLFSDGEVKQSISLDRQLLFLFIITADDEERGNSSFDFSGMNLSPEVLKHQATVENHSTENFQ